MHVVMEFFDVWVTASISKSLDAVRPLLDAFVKLFLTDNQEWFQRYTRLVLLGEEDDSPGSQNSAQMSGNNNKASGSGQGSDSGSGQGSVRVRVGLVVPRTLVA